VPGSGAGYALNLSAGEEMKELRLSLTPLGFLKRACDQTRMAIPLPAGRVHPLKLGYKNGKRELVGRALIRQHGSTGTSGELLVGWDGAGSLITSGRRPIKFSALGHPGKPQPEGRPGQRYYPAEAGALRAAPVDISAGAEVKDIQIHVRRARVFSIRGKVSAPPNTGVGTQFLTLHPKDSEPDYIRPDQVP